MDTPPPLVPAARRPKVLTAAAVINFIFGGIGLLGIFGALTAGKSSMPGLDPATVEMMNEPHFVSFQKIAGLLGGAMGLVLVLAGFGLLKCRNWARGATIAWSFYYIAITAWGSYVSAVYLMPAMQKMVETQLKAQGSGASDQGTAAAAKIGQAAGMIGAVIGILFAIAVAITLIILVTRKQAKDACRAVG